MNVYGIFGGLALLAFTASAAVYERGTAMTWKAKYDSLQASYQTAAVAAVTHAKAMEAADLKARDAQSIAAIQQATYAANQAQLAAETYKQKLAQLAGKPNLDLGHVCANTAIPAELVPK